MAELILILTPLLMRFVDLFGGSGLLSHITKSEKPHSKVVYNDFDGYRLRLEHVSQTNELLSELRKIVRGLPKHKPIVGEARKRIFECLIKHQERYGYLDFITISSSLLFSMKYCLSIDEMSKDTLYNNIRSTDYSPCDGYLNGETGAETNQAPCLSLVQFQIGEGKLVISAFQRSFGANLGLPADIYHLYLMSRQIELPLKSITLNLANVHIYKSNVERTKELLNGNKNVKFELNAHTTLKRWQIFARLK